MGYNGWTNYETWLVNVHLGSLFLDDLETFKDCTKEEIVQYLQDYINDMFYEYLPENLPTFIHDMLGASLLHLNWHELAEVYYEDIQNELEL
jgi:hypothetical protein